MHGHLKNEFTEDKKYHNLRRWLKFFVEAQISWDTGDVTVFPVYMDNMRTVPDVLHLMTALELCGKPDYSNMYLVCPKSLWTVLDNIPPTVGFS